MRYENIKTGAVVDSPFPVKGEQWVPIDNPNQETTDLSTQELRVLVLEQQTKIDDLEATIERLEKKQEVLLIAEDGEMDTSVVDDNEDEDIDLEELTKAELEDLAKEQNIKLTTNNKKNKESLIAAIVEALG